MTINPKESNGRMRWGSARGLGLLAWAFFFRVAAGDM